jgi:hypothetical protein
MLLFCAVWRLAVLRCRSGFYARRLILRTALFARRRTFPVGRRGPCFFAALSSLRITRTLWTRLRLAFLWRVRAFLSLIALLRLAALRIDLLLLTSWWLVPLRVRGLGSTPLRLGSFVVSGLRGPVFRLGLGSFGRTLILVTFRISTRPAIVAFAEIRRRPVRSRSRLAVLFGVARLRGRHGSF